MTDTTLPPEVAEAIAALDAMTYAGSRTHAHWSCVKDHLHRLAEENARLQTSLDRLYGLKFSDRCYYALMSRVEQAEAERDALRARIAAAIETVKHEGVWSDGPSEPFARIMEKLEDGE